MSLEGPRPDDPTRAPDRRIRRPAGVRPAVGVVMAVASMLLASPSPARAQPGGALKDVAFDQKLDAQVPLDLNFRDERGQSVHLYDYFGKRPVILVLGYSNCPLLCSQVLKELTRSLRVLDQSIGRDFDIVRVSINPRETPEQADSQRRQFLRQYNRPGSEPGWHALVGDEVAIARLAKAVGFRFNYSEKLNLYAHASGFVLLTPGGRISRYFYGVEYPARDLKGAIELAAASKIGEPSNKYNLFCYDYDPATGKYTFAVMSLIRVLGIATALALGTYMFAMVRRDRRLARDRRASDPELPPGPAIP